MRPAAPLHRYAVCSPTGISNVRVTSPIFANTRYRMKPTMMAAIGGQGMSNFTWHRGSTTFGPISAFQAPTTKPTAHESQPAGLKPARGPGHFQPANM